MIYLPATVGFVSATDSISYNGNPTNQHPINGDEVFVNYPGANYTNFVSREDFDNFDYKGFCKNPIKNQPRLLNKSKDGMLFECGKDKMALCPVD
jgi:hypothetical protein